MGWKPIDFQGIISLNQSLVDQLHSYMEEREALYAEIVADSIHPYQSNALPPNLPPAVGVKPKLSEAVDSLSKMLRKISQNPASLTDTQDWKNAADKINRGSWDYLELLEESVIELFQQIEQVGLEDWKDELFRVVEAVKDELMHRMDDLNWAVKRLEKHLQSYRWKSERQESRWGGFKQAFLFWQPLLDRGLSVNLYKSIKYLGFNYQKFADRYHRYETVHRKIDKSLEKFNGFEIFRKLDQDAQDKIRRLYRLARLWEMNDTAKFIPQRETIRVLRNLISPSQAYSLFREYFLFLKEALYEKSRIIKEIPNLVLEAEGNKSMQEAVLRCRAELGALGATLKKYRDFLLKSDPNPYVRSRLGFPEWVVGPEPAQAKQILSLIYEVEALDALFESFRQAVDRKPVVPDATVSDYREEIANILHEIGQPLMSRTMMRARGERLINLVQQLDELSNLHREVEEYVGEVLTKAIRVDWKFHVLFGIPSFHEVYAVHHSLVGDVGDRQHSNRLNKFKKMIHQIEQWARSDVTARHTHEIETDMNDIKGYLQDFFAQVQRAVSLGEGGEAEAQKAVSLYKKELLEYRYLFGDFFHHLSETKSEDRMLRKQFLFVDQYFDAVDKLFHAFKMACS